MSTLQRRARAENRASAMVALLLALLLYAFLPGVIPAWLRFGVAVVAVALLLPRLWVNPIRLRHSSRWARTLGIGQSFFLVAAQIVALGLLVVQLVGSTTDTAPRLLLGALQIWVVGVIAYGLVFWQLDRGGPIARRAVGVDEHDHPDFRFPQEAEPATFLPSFVDYLTLALANSIAFTPTATMPLTSRAKILISVSSFTGFVLLGVVIARGVALFI
ncbi:hypothetical protein [Frondihabitans sucicola]|uniref:hypothetical protein n=1 Tax=Frondihabitans sucicola TaxID=1268041 RepID=UPI0025737479|nr:hypothetical protein [Frondihabitans sucicola]